MSGLESFFSSWSLFAESYLVGILSAILLALLGVWVVGRRQIFLGAAIAQASGGGVAIALALQLALGLDASGMQALVPLLAALSGGLVGWIAAGSLRRQFDEGSVALIFLAGASGSVLLVAHHPEGLEIIHRLLFSTLLGATWNDVILLGAVTFLASALIVRFHEWFALLTLDPDASRLAGYDAQRWNWILSMALGIAVGLVMQATGFLYTFGFLVLPVLALRERCHEVRQLVWMAPLLAMVVSLPSFAIAYGLDLPPAQVAVAGLTGVVLLSWGLPKQLFSSSA